MTRYLRRKPVRQRTPDRGHQRHRHREARHDPRQRDRGVVRQPQHQPCPRDHLHVHRQERHERASGHPAEVAVLHRLEHRVPAIGQQRGFRDLFRRRGGILWGQSPLIQGLPRTEAELRKWSAGHNESDYTRHPNRVNRIWAVTSTLARWKGQDNGPLSLRACPGLDPGERVGVRVKTSNTYPCQLPQSMPRT